MSDSIIEIKNINVSYGLNHVLKDVNLSIDNKRFLYFFRTFWMWQDYFVAIDCWV